MSLQAVNGVNGLPMYFALSTDISNGKITGASVIGAKVYLTDSNIWYVVAPDLTLAPLMEIVSGTTLQSSVEIVTTSSQSAFAIGDAVLKNGGGLSELQNVARFNGGSGYIVAIRISTNKKSITPKMRVHFYNASDPTISNDNAAWQDKYADASKRVGYYDMAAMTTATDTTNSDMSRSNDFTMRIPFKCASSSTSLYIGLETLDAFTPDNGQKFTVTVVTETN